MSSHRVQSWRRNTKLRMIQAMGGSCVVCGYFRCSEALEFHRARIVDELRKCVLLCGICHPELHAGLVKIPKDAPRFDEKFANYREVNRQMRFGVCPVCTEPMRPNAKTCSLVCAGIKQTKGDWSKLDLAEARKTMTLVEIGQIVGVTDKAVSKRLKKLGLR